MLRERLHFSSFQRYLLTHTPSLVSSPLCSPNAAHTRGRKKGGGKGRRKQFIQSAEEIGQRDDKEAAWKEERAAKRKQGQKERGLIESSEEEEDVDADEDSGAEGAMGELGEEIAALGIEGETGSSDGLTRSEREALSKTSSDRAYAIAHAAGQTEESQSDMARLAEIRARRAVDKKRREEREAKEARLKEAAAAEAAAPSKKKKKKKKEEEEMEYTYVTPIKIKKMKPAKMKEILKEHGQDYQGNKKEILKRLLGFNALHAP